MKNLPATLFAGILLLYGLTWPTLVEAARTAAPFDQRQNRDALFEWSPLIQQVQELLIEFDLFAGPVNGRLTPETQRAIRAYQKQSELSETGNATEDLLKHMETVGRAATLKKRLAKARDEQIEKARKALQNSEATRDLLKPANTILAALPPDKFDACLRAPDIDCLLSGATAALQDIEREDYRDWALREVVRAQGAVGRTEAARTNIKRLSDLRLVLVALREVAASLSDAGYDADALRLTETIPDPWNKARALVTIAESATNAAPARTALLHLLPKLKDREGALEIAAELLANTEEPDARATIAAAIETLLAEQRDPSPITLGAIAAAYARADLERRALAMLDRIGEASRDQIALAEAAGLLARKGKLSEAMLRADRLRTPQLFVLALTKVADAQRDRREIAGAAASLTRAEVVLLDIERPFAADSARARIAEAWVQLGNADQAIENAQAINSRGLKAQTLWELAALGHGQNTDFVVPATAATERMESAFDRAATLARAARGFAEAGLTERAKETFGLAVRETKAIRRNWWRARILSLLATVLAEL